MSATGLIGIKRRIKSVMNTQKITKAMGLVATAKLRKSRKRLYQNAKYSKDFENIKDNIVGAIEDKNIYMDNNRKGKDLYLVISSNLGLCGGYNVNVVSETINYIKNREDCIIVVIGKKGKVYFNKFKIKIDKEFIDVSELPGLEDVKDVSDTILKMYESGEISSINVVYTHFISSIKQKVEKETLLPVKNNNNDNNVFDFEFEVTPDKILENIIKIYLNDKILNLLLSSKVSEQASRMTAMNGATKNAKELLDKLRTQYNRIRQSAITEEISEIIGGAESQK